MAFWRDLSTKADKLDHPMSKPATRRMWASGPIVRTSGVPYRTDWDTDRGVREGMLRSVWTYKAIDTIAKSISRLPIVMPRGTYEADSLVDPRDAPMLLRRLNYKASPYEPAVAFRYRLISQLLISKKGVFVEYETDAHGEVKWMWLLNPDKVAPIPSERNFIEGYEIDNNGEPDRLPADRVMWIRIPHPTDPYASFPPLEAAGLSIDLDYYGRLWNRNFMAKDGRPGGILAVKGPVPEADVEIMRSRLNNYGDPGAISVIESEGMSFADLSTTPRDASYTNLANQVKNEILVAFGVAESVIGNASGRTYDNADAEENVYWRMTCNPLIHFVDMHLSDMTPGRDSDDLWVRHDTSTVQALQRPIRENETRVIEHFREGTATLNDVLAVLKQDPLEMPGANTYFIPAGKVGIGRDETEQQAIANLKAVGGAEAGAPPGGPGGPGMMQQPSRISQILAARQQRMALGPGVPAPPSTVRSPEAVAMAAGREAEATAARREADRESKADGESRHYVIMLPLQDGVVTPLWKASPVRPDTSSPHVTVGLFDTPSPGAALQIAEEWARSSEPIKLVIGPTTWVWENGTDGRPFVAAVASDSLHEANERLAEIVERHGGTMAGKGVDDYQPHFTIAYLPADVSVSGLRENVGVVTTATTAILSTPDKEHSALPLGDA